MRREEVNEALESFFGFTQVFGIAVRERTNVSVAERADLCAAHHMTVAATAKDQFFSRRSACYFPARRTYLDEIVRKRKLIDSHPLGRSICVLEYQFEAAVIEGSSWRPLHLCDAFAQSLIRQLERAMMAVGIISGTSEKNTRGPGAAGFADVSVVTTAAKAPQLFARSSAIYIQLVCRPPDIFETEVANVAAGIFRG